MALAQTIAYIDEDDYMSGEEVSRVRHEYVNGQVYAMAGSSDRHSIITVNAVSLLSPQLPDFCEVFTADMKVRIRTEKDLAYYYPDMVVSCAEDDRATYYREKPCLLIEVLSPRHNAWILLKFFSPRSSCRISRFPLCKNTCYSIKIFRKPHCTAVEAAGSRKRIGKGRSSLNQSIWNSRSTPCIEGYVLTDLDKNEEEEVACRNESRQSL